MSRAANNWILWVVAFPIALITAIILEFILHGILFILLTSFIDPYPELPESVIAPFFRALAIVLVTSIIVPNHKFKIAKIIMSIWIIVASVVFTLGFIEYNVDNIQLDLEGNGLPVVMGVLGAMTGVYLVRIKS